MPDALLLDNTKRRFKGLIGAIESTIDQYLCYVMSKEEGLEKRNISRSKKCLRFYVNWFPQLWKGCWVFPFARDLSFFRHPMRQTCHFRNHHQNLKCATGTSMNRVTSKGVKRNTYCMLHWKACQKQEYTVSKSAHFLRSFLHSSGMKSMWG